ncbi:MAG: DNA repair protein RadA [Ignavibacterium sp.]|nr:DNA repair protein RadA [Ignavibacterium sp.]
MSKSKTKYVCSNCGYESLKWIGKCPECDSWNTFVEEIFEPSKKVNLNKKVTSNYYKLIDISAKEEERILTNISEFDRVLGGGLIPGSVILLAGDPGIGKSTLALQSTALINEPILYVSGEESEKQIKLRATRLNISSDSLFILSETELEQIISLADKLKPKIVFIDSIQTIFKSEIESSPGTITQIRECTVSLIEYAKTKNVVVILIGHVTKEGNIAGPKILEHMVDTVIHFEGELNHSFRILRAKKNRYGSTNEIGVFEMRENGLVEVTNPSELFLSERDKATAGSSVTAIIEGSRPILIEVQALVTPSNYGYPQRVSNGFDQRRLSILLAVLEKRVGVKLSAANVFLNIVGGIKIKEPAADLAVCLSIISSIREQSIDSQTILIGEVGLGGELRSVPYLEKRIAEAEKLGFITALVPSNNSKSLIQSNKIKIVSIEDLSEAIEKLLSEI